MEPLAKNDSVPSVSSHLTVHRRWRVLLVGDGDFSGSLALKRAYPQHLENVVASTVLSSFQELQATYPSTAKSNVNELLATDGDENGEVSVEILYNVDATKLHQDERLLAQTPLDIICFQFPHVGYSHDKTVDHMTRENIHLVKAYLQSAHALLQHQQEQSSSEEEEAEQQRGRQPIVHVTLSQTCISNWNLPSIIQEFEHSYQLTLQAIEPISKPMFDGLFVHEESMKNSESHQQQQYTSLALLQRAQKSKGRRGHWLGKYGYRHLPTNPDFDVTRSTSVQNPPPGEHQTSDKKSSSCAGGREGSFESKDNVSNSHHYFFRHVLERPTQSSSSDTSISGKVMNGNNNSGTKRTRDGCTRKQTTSSS